MKIDGTDQVADTDIAIVGMALRCPGARSVAEFWSNLRAGVTSLTTLPDDQLRASGVPEELIADPDYVKAAYTIPDMDAFDAEFFGISPLDASIMDPQHRHFLEVCWEALESAGHTPARFDGNIGVFAGTGMNYYFALNLLTNPKLVEEVGHFLLRHDGNDKDFFATRVSYLLDLRGPSLTVQTACSTSLVAIHLACQSLLGNECDMAIAGGATVRQPHHTGYLYREGEILSPDGLCRPFDADSEGTVFGSGAGAVILRRAADAVADGDTIHAIIKGSAVNNDGAMKVGYLAPSVGGQAMSVAEALAVADVPAESVSYIETHGTGTPVGDPIELAALTQAFRGDTDRTQFCAIGSVKSNVGHLDCAAGVAGLIKTALALEHGELPASLHYRAPNPEIDFQSSPFFVNAERRAWAPPAGYPRRAGVSSLGVGGTNAHVILQQPPAPSPAEARRPWRLVPVSAKTDLALDRVVENLARHLREHPDVDLDDTAYTLQVGREPFGRRAAVVGREAGDLASGLEALRGRPGAVPAEGRSVAFLFAGGGAQYPRMGMQLHEAEPVYREALERCLTLLEQHVDADLRAVLDPPGDGEGRARAEIEKPSIALPLLFSTQYAQAQQWIAWGIEPSAMIGHSMGEYTAACLAGVFSLEDALDLVAMRGRLFETLPEGGMLSVPLGEDELRAHMGDELSVAAVNGPELCVASGPVHAIDDLARRLAAEDVESQRIHISVAAHSSMLTPILDEFGRHFQRVTLSAPRMPFVSNLSGTWITAEEATSPEYWVRHLRHTVRFADGVQKLLEDESRICLEVGPGRTLSTLARMHPVRRASQPTLQSLRHPGEEGEDLQVMLSSLARMWEAGLDVDWPRLHGERRRRVPLPTYPFERERHYIEPGKTHAAPEDDLSRADDVGDWLYQPVWRPAPPRTGGPSEGPVLVIGAETDVGRAVVEDLRNAGRAAVTVSAGDGFEDGGDGSYTIRPGRREDYGSLINALGSVPARVLHLWSTTTGPASPDVDLTRGFHDLLALAQALGEEDGSEVRLVVGTTGAQPTSGTPVTHPERAAVAGPCKVMSRELEAVEARSVDLDPTAAPSAQAARLVRELDASESEIVSFRGDRRLARGWERIRVEPPIGGASLLREGGTYLITGGLGGIGLALAEHLAERWKARLVLTARTELPPREEWDRWVAGHDDADRTSRRIRLVRRLEGLGGQVMVAAVDVTDTEGMRALVDDVHVRFGPIDGALHAAGTLDDGLILGKEPDAAAAVLAPKVRGTAVLREALADEPLAFAVLFSSRSAITGIAGQVDYAAANAVLDSQAFAWSAAGGPFVVSLNWSAWRDVGMAAELAGRLREIPAERVETPVSYPLFERCHEGAHGREFLGEINTRDHWLVGEHRIKDGEALIPGTGYLELVRAAAQADGANGRMLVLQDVMFIAPFVVHDDASRHLRVSLTQTGDEAEVVIEGSPTGEDPESWEEHARGTVRSETVEPPPVRPLQEILSRCPDVEEARDRSEETFLQLGPRWSNKRRSYVGRGEAVVEIELPEAYLGDMDEYLLHPALLDVATAGAQTLIPGYDPARDFFVPASYGTVWIRAALTPRLFSHIRYRGDAEVEDFATFDISILDEEGRELVGAEEFTMVRVQDRGLMNRERTSSAGAAAPAAPLAIDLDEATSPEEGIEVFRRILAGRVPPQVVVSPQDLNAWIRALDAPPEEDAATAAPGREPPVDVAAIEDALRTHEAVDDAAVNAYGRGDDIRIVAHVVHDVDADVTVSELRRYLRDRLPEELVPQHFLEVEDPPRNSDGSIDKSRLEDPFAPVDDYVAPRNDTESVIAEVWQELLGLDRVSVHDNFLDIGGHSLLAMRAMTKIKKKIGVRITASAINMQTLEQIAAQIEREHVEA